MLLGLLRCSFPVLTAVARAISTAGTAGQRQAPPAGQPSLRYQLALDAPELTPHAQRGRSWDRPASNPTIRVRAFMGRLAAFRVGPFGKPLSGNLLSWFIWLSPVDTSVPSLFLTPYKTYSLLTYTNLLVTVVTVVTMPVPQ